MTSAPPNKAPHRLTSGMTVVLGGVGLIGGSLGLRLRSLPDPPRVIGFSRSPDSLRRAVEKGAIESFETDPKKAVAEADLVVLGAPVMAIPEIVSEIASALKPGAIVTDVGSTKAWIEKETVSRLPKKIRFVGSHPMAGSEKSGIEFADAALFEQAICVVTPTSSSDEGAILLVKEMWERVGAITLMISPDMHDRIVAAISHLPHVVAAALVNAVNRRAVSEPRIFDLAAGGFRDTTRIAASHPAVWRDICLTNREAILGLLDEMRKEFDGFADALKKNDGERITDFFEDAATARARIPPKGSGLLPSIIDLFVDLPDRPGAIAEVTGVLGKQDINIVDIEVTRLRGGDVPAPLRLFFNDEEARERATRALAEAGYNATVAQ